MSLALSVAFLAVGHVLVPQRHSGAVVDWYDISPDARVYISMVEGADAELPYSRRILVPHLASLIPSTPENALKIVSYCSILMFYFISFISLNYVKFGFRLSVFSLCTIFSSMANLLLFQNPHIIDAFCHMCTALMLYFLFSENAVAYALAASTGVLSHEMALFGAPSFFSTGRWRAALAIVILTSGLFFATHVAESGDSIFYELPTFKPSLVLEAYLAWGFLWIPMMLGLFLGRREYFLKLSFMFFLTIFGALISSIVARGTIRMFSAILPVSAILIAAFLEKLKSEKAIFKIVFLGLLASNFVFAIPTRLSPEMGVNFGELEDFYRHFRYPIMLIQGIGLGFGAWLFGRWRTEALGNLKNNLRVAKEMFLVAGGK